MFVHFVRFAAHSELSEQQLEQPDAGGRVEPFQMDVSTTQEEVSILGGIM